MLLLFLFRKVCRSIEGKKKSNLCAKNRMRKKKAIVKNNVTLTKKDHEITVLQNKLKQSEKHLKLSVNEKSVRILNMQMSIKLKTAMATVGKHHYNISKSREHIISSLSSIPGITSLNYEDLDKYIGSGQFGTIQLGRIKSLDIVVAAKIQNNEKSVSKQALLVEVISMLSLSGHVNFPFCFGLLKNGTILMEYLGKFASNAIHTWPNLSQVSKSRHLNVPNFIFVCKNILEAVIFIHKKQILHNDIKADNVVVSDYRVVLIDFGKVTAIKQPIVYNITPGSEENITYNKHHRHLAYELRNVPNTKQSIQTDTYSVGYMLKHCGALITYQPIIEIGRLLKNQCVELRISLENALDKINILAH